MTFGSHVLRLLGLPGFEARVIFGAEPVREANRKELAKRLRDEVDRQFRAVVSGRTAPGVG